MIRWLVSIIALLACLILLGQIIAAAILGKVIIQDVTVWGFVFDVVVLIICTALSVVGMIGAAQAGRR